jgi:glutaredoxin-like protein NrdH
MKFSKVVGKQNSHKVVLYALSTCVWCKMTKQFLKDNNVEFEGGSLSYPTTIVDENVLITGFRKDQLKEALGI